MREKIRLLPIIGAKGGSTSCSIMGYFPFFTGLLRKRVFFFFFPLSHDSVEHLRGEGFAFFHRNQAMNIFPGTNVGPVTKEH